MEIFNKIISFQAFFLEFILTMILVWVYAAASDDIHQAHQETWPIRYGLATMGLLIASTSFTHGSVNPIRGFGPGILNLPFEQTYWIYWIAPIVASPIAGLIYRMTFRYRHGSRTTDWCLFWDFVQVGRSY